MIIESSNVILFTGTPGTGKTTISRLINSKLNGIYLNLTEFSKSQDLVLEKDVERDTLIIDIESLKKRLSKIINSTNKIILIDSHFSTDVVELSKVKYVIVLRRAPWLLFNELMERCYDIDKIKENVEAEIIGVCLSSALDVFEKEKIIEIDTTNSTPEKIAEYLLLIINGKTQATYGNIDWMAYPEIETLLKRLNYVSGNSLS
ncbi:AAA family ATPase [Candidatus Bathyarchaeota archaeon]|nr:AAA family ATPase [Candidatus Bathyarchaeota archaeon]